MKKDRTTLKTINFELPGHLFDLLQEQTNNIQYAEIDTPEKREEKLKEIKQKLLWQEVTIGDFNVVANRSETIPVAPSFSNPFNGQTANVNIITVEAKITGNPELFDYSPQAIRFSSNMDNNIYQPIGDKITLEIQSSTLDKKFILTEAKKKMTMTEYVIENNNKFITDYNRSFENTIEERFDQKADEIIDLYS
ncbi:hypothetical protein MQX03_00265 [Chryseobacterium aahli]|uniref:hypothetical protein n=1 Tax=Chryseobacterium aahli TaxID=1278643 RepID=UPI001F6127F9|nr:hypothetical protein [Chryseobacterium aahli]MCI3935614.1 hypothetical protein [Chryseobacterium aahli]